MCALGFEEQALSVETRCQLKDASEDSNQDVLVVYSVAVNKHGEVLRLINFPNQRNRESESLNTQQRQDYSIEGQ
jgi:hypothetical protein